jgi:hypothetical protein
MIDGFNIINQIYSTSNSTMFKVKTDLPKFVALKLTNDEELAQNEVETYAECQH